MPRRQQKQKQPSQVSNRKKYGIIALSIIIVLVVGGALFYGLNGSIPSSFSTFKSNFNSAPRVALLVTAYNGSALSATIGCATSIIEQIISNQASHRNATTIDYYVMNKTTCVYSTTGLGSSIKNYTYTTPQTCVALSNNEPRIFINYSNTNSTYITATSMYVSGNAKFLLQCGVATSLVTPR